MDTVHSNGCSGVRMLGCGSVQDSQCYKPGHEEAGESDAKFNGEKHDQAHIEVDFFRCAPCLDSKVTESIC